MGGMKTYGVRTWVLRMAYQRWPCKAMLERENGWGTICQLKRTRAELPHMVGHVLICPSCNCMSTRILGPLQDCPLPIVPNGLDPNSRASHHCILLIHFIKSD